jgi:hypothetical protein
MQLACTPWNGPVYRFGRTDTPSGTLRAALICARRATRGPSDGSLRRVQATLLSAYSVVAPGRRDVPGRHGQCPVRIAVEGREIGGPAALLLRARQFIVGLPARAEHVRALIPASQAGPSRRSSVRLGGFRRPLHLGSIEAPRAGRISRNRARSAPSGPSHCHPAWKRPRRPVPQRRPSRI